MNRTLRPLAALAMIALLSAGCSNALAETGNNTAATREKAVKFAECMRNNGVREFPDPNASGEFAYGIERGSSLDPSTAVWKKAIDACKDLQPPGALDWSTQSMEERPTLDLGGLERFFGAAKGEGLEALWIVWCLTGLRPGEILGLKWADVRLPRMAATASCLSGARGRRPRPVP